MESKSATQSVPASSPPSPIDLHEAIRRRAEAIYIRSGRIPDRDLQNWSQAEQEIRSESQQPKRRTAIIVSVNGVQYVGEYRADLADGYVPGEFEPGSSVAVLLDGNKMLVRRPNGKVLETEVVHKIG
jgi:hypothetical protein